MKDLPFVFEEVNDVLFLKALINMKDVKLITLAVKEIQKELNYTEHFLEFLLVERNEKDIRKLFNLGGKFSKEELIRQIKDFVLNVPTSMHISSYLIGDLN